MRKRETNRWIRREEYQGAGRRRGEKETEPRKRVSLTNATRGHGRRVIITHLSPVGSASLVESVGGAPVGPRRGPRSAICRVYGCASAIVSFTPFDNPYWLRLCLMIFCQIFLIDR